MFFFFGGGGQPLIWPIQVCAAEQGVAFKVLSIKQGIQGILLSVFSRVSF